MGAVFGVLFFIWLLIVGLSGIELSIAGIIVSSIFSKKGKRFANPLKVASIVLLTIYALITLIPTGYFSFIFVANTMPPEDYVETKITVEENGYQDERFTADGKVYEVIDLYVNNEVTITSNLEDIDSYDIDLISSDKLIYVTSYYFVYLNDSMYYIYESTFIEDVGFENTLILLDDQLNTHFINIIENI